MTTNKWPIALALSVFAAAAAAEEAEEPAWDVEAAPGEMR
jgi:hypothetical protein